jgi:hypothetical protein
MMGEEYIGKPIELSQFDYAWDEGFFWSELSTLFFSSRASSSPRKEITAGGAQRNTLATSFDDFQESVSDAWDLGDDEFCVISGNSYQNKYS